MSSIKTVDGKEVVCRGVSTVILKIHEQLLRAEAIVMNEIIEGMDVISQLGGVTFYENDTVEFRKVHCAVSMYQHQ